MQGISNSLYEAATLDGANKWQQFRHVTLPLSLIHISCSGSPSGPAGEESGGDENAPVTIRFWNGWTGPDGDKLTELVNQYNEKNTDNVTIEMDIMEFASLGEKMTTSLASDTNPELHLGFANGEYSYDGSYIPIDDIFEKTILDKDDFV